MMTIEERIETLEKELARTRSRNRWLTAALLLVGVGAVAGLGRASVAEKEVRAKSFIVEDEKGRTRAKLSVRENAPVLSLFDENEKLRVGLTATKDGPALTLLDENGKPIGKAP